MSARFRHIGLIFVLLTCANPSGRGYLADREWKSFPEGDARELPSIEHLATFGNQAFAVGDDGLFYRFEDDSFVRIKAPSAVPFHHVWARSEREVYVLADDGAALLFDGRSLAKLGSSLPDVKRKTHPFTEAQACRPDLRTLWASSPTDVWAVGDPMVLFHYDGKTWSEVDIGAAQVIVPSQSRLTRAVATPRIGPVWGTGPRDVWVRKEVVEPVALDEGFEPGRPLRRDRYRVTHRLMRFDGERWHETDKTLPLEGLERRGRGFVVPEVQVVGENAIWTQFDNALHRWEDDDWKLVVELPASKKPWTWWTAGENGTALIYRWPEGFRVFKNGDWTAVPLSADDNGSKLPQLLGDGSIVARGPYKKKIIVGR